MSKQTTRCFLLASLFLASFLLASCGEAPPSVDAVATFRGGIVTLEQAELALRQEGRLRRDLAGEDLLAAYRRASETTVFGQRLLAQAGDLDTDPAKALAALGEDAAKIRQQSVLDLYRRESLGGQSLQVMQQDLDAYYSQHEETFERRGKRDVWHIFIRHTDPKRPAETLEQLRSLKGRAEAGETFASLARQYSQSETRQFDGRLGWVQEGRLPPAIEKAVFSLRSGEIGAPLALGGGAALFRVTGVVEAKHFSQADVRDVIIRQVAEEKTRQAVDVFLNQRQPPEGSLVLEIAEVMTLLSGEVEEDTVLEIGDFALTVGEMKEQLEEDAKTFKGDWAPSLKERVGELYARQVQNQLLFLDAEQSGFADLPENSRAIDERMQFLGRSRLLQDEIDRRMQEKVKASPGELKSFYEANDFLYQSDLRLRLKTLRLPLTAGGSGRMAKLQGARARLMAGELELKQAASELGGRIVDGGWVDFDRLNTFEPKVRHYVLELNGTGYSTPFQLNDALQMIWVQEREEPRQLPFSEVEEKVRADYLDRNQQMIYRQILDDELARIDFRFHPEHLRQLLGLAEQDAAIQDPAIQGAEAKSGSPKREP